MNKILIKDNKFKSMLININYILPLNEKENGKNALVALVLEQGSNKYRTEKEIEIALASLYNSSIDLMINKLGDNYSITFSLSIINKRYIKKDVLRETLEILKNIIYDPYLENGAFCKTYVEREKKSLISRIESIKNDKRRYAIQRLEEEMFKGEVYGVNQFGEIKDIIKETPESIYNQYLKIIKESNINVVISGNTEGYDNILDEVIKILNIKPNISKKYKYSKPKLDFQKTKNIKEDEDLSQSILCIGLKFKNLLKEEIFKANIYNTILGGTPASKLFQNVREKESLAYFAGSKYIKFKDAIYIYTGINILNLEKAKQVILKQVEDMKNGDITDDEFNAAKLYRISKLNLIKDSKEALSMYTIANNILFNSITIDLEKTKEKLNKVSKKDVIDVAKKAYVDTIYLLGGNE